MKKMKKIVAAAMAMMTFSTAAAVTGTVAWFTASNVVTANGMSLTADTEQGINISNELKTEWKETAVASHSGLKSDGQTSERFIPTTTTDAVTWKHGNSNDRNSSTAAEPLVNLHLGAISNGIASVDEEGSAIDGKNVYLVNVFHLRSSTPDAVEAENLYVNFVEVTGSTASTDLDKSFRVLVKSEKGDIKIFSPLEDAADTIAPAIIKGTKNTVLSTGVTIPAASDNSEDDTYEIEVYCYFDGNDSHCMSKNIIDGDFSKLAITCKFGTEIIA